MTDPRFIHLNVHTEFSLVDSMVRIKPLMKTLGTLEMPAVAITDYCNLFAAVKIQSAAWSAGIKPIFGVDVRVAKDLPSDDPAKVGVQKSGKPDSPALDRVTLMIMNYDGYLRVTRWLSRAYLEGQGTGQPVLQLAWLEETGAEGVIAIAGFKDGPFAVPLGDAPNGEVIKRWATLFNNRLYLEVMRTGVSNDETSLGQVVEVAQQFELPVVATNAVRFLKKDDYEAHDVRVCIRQGFTQDNPNRPHDYTDEQYLKSPQEMEQLFADLPSGSGSVCVVAKARAMMKSVSFCDWNQPFHMLCPCPLMTSISTGPPSSL